MQMIANAVPPPLAEKIGEVILARAEGRSIPAIDPGFEKFLQDHPDKDFTPASIANVKSRVNRARRLLHGRTYADIALELAELEDTVAFSTLDVRQKSDLRAALRLYHEYMSDRPPSKYARKILKKGEKPKPVMPDFGRRPRAADALPTDAAPSGISSTPIPSKLRRRPAPQTPDDEPIDSHIDEGLDMDPRHEPDMVVTDRDRLDRDE